MDFVRLHYSMDGVVHIMVGGNKIYNENSVLNNFGLSSLYHV